MPEAEPNWRLFVALDVPPAAAAPIRAIQRQWEGRCRARFTPPENLHLTLKFLGERPVDEVPALRAALRSVPFAPFTGTLDELGVFAGRGPLRILWLRLAGPEVMALQTAVDAALADRFAPETRFMSHLTIARLKQVPDRRRFLDELAAFTFDPIPFPVTAFTLKRSVLTPDGPIYSDVERYS